jgi:hypothetical protein
VKTASILLALIVVLGFCREAGAWEYPKDDQRDYSIHIGTYRFGFFEWVDEGTSQPTATLLLLGPFGNRISPFNATQSLIGCSVILAVLITLPVAATVRWRNKRVVP